ncbi:hypothetical protein D3C85_1862560 [compost metagenome]
MPLSNISTVSVVGGPEGLADAASVVVAADVAWLSFLLSLLHPANPLVRSVKTGNMTIILFIFFIV